MADKQLETPEEQMRIQQLQKQYDAMKEQAKQINAKIGEMNGEVHEHK